MTANDAAPTLPRPRADAFYKLAVGAIESEQDAQAAAKRIAEAHESERGAWDARWRGAQAEASQMSAELRRRVEMLGHAANVTSRELAAGAAMSATVAHQAQLLGRLRSAAQQSLDGSMSAVDVLSMLSESVATPDITPMVIGFVSDGRYRSGRFVSTSGDITVVYPFVGFSLTVKGPGKGAEVEPTFLVEDRALCRSAIQIERGLILQGTLAPMTAAGAR
ncbi:hypothetical protein SAMN05216223_12087 [Actinacidiphila yanglinensis]|uniref:Uncharacterized protein n=1 Tax=Actinacidiphila yanglinensis TaxID=310779 RepID=A0A1H6DXZ0_9ACTN|nr:hypothetical protein [Actinacidiphila yanglinensis]SEG89455.1 hypothetical protein SAMN05216223_12087 [Actinacidiphila yanglinensis]